MRTFFLLLLAATTIVAADNTVHTILFTGQSLSVGTGGSPCLSHSQPPLNATGWVSHKVGSWPAYNVAYIGTSMIDFTPCRAPQYQTIAGTVAVDTSGNVTGTGTTFATTHNNGIMIVGGVERIFTYISATSGTVTPAPASALPPGTTFSLSTTSGSFQSSEPHSIAAVNTLTNLHPLKDWVGTGVSAGVQGYSYSQLKQATTPYTTSISTLTTIKNHVTATDAATARPRPFTVSALDIVHGEADAVYPSATYVANLLEWHANYLADAKAVTGQSADFPMFTDQYSSWARNSATPTVGRAATAPALPTTNYPIGAIYWNTTQNKYFRNVGNVWTDDSAGVCSPYPAGYCGNTPMGQWHAARDNPGKLFLVGPKYQYKYSDGLHLRNYSYRHLGEMHGKAMAKVLHSGEQWIPLAPRSLTRSGAVIQARFWVPVGCLQFDSTRSDEAVQQFPKLNEGFEYFDSANSASISSVAITSCDTVTITLNTAPTGANQRLRYAFTGTVGAAGGTANAARGTLADTDPTIGLSGLPLRDYAISFDEPLGFHWEPKGESRTATAAAGLTAAKFTYSPAVNEACTLQAATDAGFNSIAASSWDMVGTRTREILISGLTQSTTYYFRAVCPSGTYATTAGTTAALAANASLLLRFRPPVGRGVDNVLVEYGTSGTSLDNGTSVACASSCSVTLSNLTPGTAMYVKHTYRTAGNAAVAGSRVALQMVE